MIRIRELAAPEWELDDWDDVSALGVAPPPRGRG